MKAREGMCREKRKKISLILVSASRQVVFAQSREGDQASLERRRPSPNLHHHSQTRTLITMHTDHSYKCERRCSQCVASTVNPAQQFFWGYPQQPYYDGVEHIVRVTTAERKPYAFQRLFRSTNMRLGRVPFFLSSSQVWARPPFRPFLFAAQLERLARVPDCQDQPRNSGHRFFPSR
jgi:hypothetical protein